MSHPSALVCIRSESPAPSMPGRGSPSSILSRNHAATRSSKSKPGPPVDRVVTEVRRRAALSPSMSRASISRSSSASSARRRIDSPCCSLRLVRRALPSVDGCKRYAQPFGELLLSELELRSNGAEDGGHAYHVCDICYIAVSVDHADGSLRNTRTQRSKSVACAVAFRRNPLLAGRRPRRRERKLLTSNASS